MGSNPVNDKENEQDLVFLIRVQYRRNSSMQGSVQWMSGKKKRIFRSVLELGNLISDAKAQTSGGKGKKHSLYKWEDQEGVS